MRPLFPQVLSKPYQIYQLIPKILFPTDIANLCHKTGKKTKQKREFRNIHILLSLIFFFDQEYHTLLLPSLFHLQ